MPERDRRMLRQAIREMLDTRTPKVGDERVSQIEMASPGKIKYGSSHGLTWHIGRRFFEAMPYITRSCHETDSGNGMKGSALLGLRSGLAANAHDSPHSFIVANTSFNSPVAVRELDRRSI